MERLRTIMINAGFNMVKASCINCSLFPAIAGVWLMQRFFGITDADNVKMYPPFINRMLAGLFAGEGHLLKFVSFRFIWKIPEPGYTAAPSIRRHQEFWWRDSGVPTNDVAKNRILGGEQIPDEVDRIAEVHLEILPDRGIGWLPGTCSRVKAQTGLGRAATIDAISRNKDSGMIPSHRIAARITNPARPMARSVPGTAAVSPFSCM